MNLFAKQKLIQLLPPKIYLQIRRRKYIEASKREFEMYQKLRKGKNKKGYSLKPFDEKKSIFVHIPKCAGISINQSIFGCLAGGHTSFDYYLRIFEAECILSYFKFTIARNPWDRLVSAYFFMKKGGLNEIDYEWSRKELSQFSTFDDFVRNWLNEENICKHSHFRPQSHYILDKRGKVELDFIGFIENIKDDFSYIQDCLGLNEKLQESNSSSHRPYTSYYTDETRKIVEQIYKEDIVLLGYEFDNSSLSSQLSVRQKSKRT
jgi:hypothetical protein